MRIVSWNVRRASVVSAVWEYFDELFLHRFVAAAIIGPIGEVLDQMRTLIELSNTCIERPANHLEVLERVHQRGSKP